MRQGDTVRFLAIASALSACETAREVEEADFALCPWILEAAMATTDHDHDLEPLIVADGVRFFLKPRILRNMGLSAP